MLDIKKIGAFIAHLRKAKDITQVELADHLNVSHQAVSKWERGESMPDIGTLPMLARELGVTTDELFYGEIETHRQVGQLQAFVEALGESDSEKAGKMILTGQVGVEELADLAPIIKPSTARQMAPHLLEIFLTIDDAISLAPFLEQDILEQVLRHTDFNLWTWDKVCQIAPFVRRTVLAEWVNSSANQNPPSLRQVISMAPFLERMQLGAIVKQIQEDQWSLDALTAIAPFVSRELLNDLVRSVSDEETPDKRYVIALAPFISREILDIMVAATIETWDWDSVKAIAPFVSQRILSRIVSQLMKSIPDAHHLLAIAPFLERVELGRFVQNAIEHKEN